MQYCGFCGQRWDQSSQQVPYRSGAGENRPWAPKSPRRKSPRQRPWTPNGPSSSKGPGKGKAKAGKPGAQPPQPTVETYLVAPWQPEGVPTTGEPRPSYTEDPQWQELWGALRSSAAQQALPPTVAEALAKVEGLQGRQVTKSMHAQTKTMGSAKKQLHEIQEARRRQDNSWVEFLNQTLLALEQGAQKYDEAVQKFDEQEKEAKQRLAAARAAIKELAGHLEKEVPDSVCEDEISDLELMDTTQTSGTGVPEESKVVQAQKKLRVTKAPTHRGRYTKKTTIMAFALSAFYYECQGRGWQGWSWEGCGQGCSQGHFAPWLGHHFNARGPFLFHQVENSNGSGWPVPARHSIEDEDDFLSPDAAATDASLWSCLCRLQEFSESAADDLASLQGSITLKSRWFDDFSAEVSACYTEATAARGSHLTAPRIDLRAVGAVDGETDTRATDLRETACAEHERKPTVQFLFPAEVFEPCSSVGEEALTAQDARLPSISCSSSAGILQAICRSRPCCRQVGTMSEPTADQSPSNTHADGGHTFHKASAKVQYALRNLELDCEMRPSPTQSRDVPVIQVPKGFEQGTPVVPRELACSHPGNIALIRAESIQILPQTIRAAPLFTAPVGAFSWGDNDFMHGGRFTVFDIRRHVTVQRAFPGASLQDIVAVAVNSAPFTVQSIQVLADTVEGYPIPQLVLHSTGYPITERPIPWDLRPIGDQVRTIIHVSRETANAALRKAQRAIWGQLGFRGVP